ncbi:hypothetical protein NMY22_g784 [Coprinellus aureogranulatus]|nr:hypothetical protein NMY22_g784 [Coprinellus aureogranulatus]
MEARAMSDIARTFGPRGEFAAPFAFVSSFGFWTVTLLVYSPTLPFDEEEDFGSLWVCATPEVPPGRWHMTSSVPPEMGSFSYAIPKATHLLRETERSRQLCFLSFWLGAIIYGVYILLFVLSVKIAAANQRIHSTFPAKVFLASTGAMFILAMTYMGFSTSRFLYAFGLEWQEASDGKLPIQFLNDYSSFRNLAPSIMMSLQVWFGDALAIYRCLIVWDMDWRIVALPILLLAYSIVNNSLITVELVNPRFLAPGQVERLIDSVFPTNIIQSCITTSLISFKIWNRHRLSRAAGLSELGSEVRLLTVVRFIVESTMIFTIQQIVTCILYYLDQPAQYIFHGTLVPSIGITFVLLSIRTHEAKKRARNLGTLIQHTSGGLPPSMKEATGIATTEVGERAPSNRPRNHRRTMSDSFALCSTRAPEVHGLSTHSMERVDHDTGRDRSGNSERGELGGESA